MITRHFIAYTPIIFRCIPNKTSFSKYLCSDFALTYIIYPSFGEYVCICTGVQRNGPAMAMTVNRATPSKDEIKQVFLGHINSGSLVCTDGAKGYEVLRTAVEGCSVVKVKQKEGSFYHLNTVNAFHSCIKRLNSTFRGVATKYLNRYNGLFSLIFRKGEEIRDALSSCIRKPSTVCCWTPVLEIKLQGVLNLCPTT